MIWERTQRIQTVSALLLLGLEPALAFAHALMKKSPIYGDLELAHGQDWLVIFGILTKGEDSFIMPHFTGDNAHALYQNAHHIWQAVGTDLHIPEHARPDFIENLTNQHSPDGHDMVIIPKFLHNAPRTETADVYMVTERVALHTLVPSTQENAPESLQT